MRNSNVRRIVVTLGISLGIGTIIGTVIACIELTKEPLNETVESSEEPFNKTPKERKQYDCGVGYGYIHSDVSICKNDYELLFDYTLSWNDGYFIRVCGPYPPVCRNRSWCVLFKKCYIDDLGSEPPHCPSLVDVVGIMWETPQEHSTIIEPTKWTSGVVPWYIAFFLIVPMVLLVISVSLTLFYLTIIGYFDNGAIYCIHCDNYIRGNFVKHRKKHEVMTFLLCITRARNEGYIRVSQLDIKNIASMIS